MPPALRASDELLFACPFVVQERLGAGRGAHCAPPVAARVCGLSTRVGGLGTRVRGLERRGKTGEMARSDGRMAASGVVARRVGARDREEEQNA